jgi:mono/diheme cytochrome c family protein
MKKALFIVFCMGVLGLTACGENVTSDVDIVSTLAPVPTEYAGQVNPLGPDAAAEGAIIFKTNCAACHGRQGKGDGPAGEALYPRPKNLAELQAGAGDDYLYWRINTGKEGTSMAPWKGALNDKQIWQVVSFINTLK